MIETNISLRIRKGRKTIARARVTNVPAWLLKTRTNKDGGWLYVRSLWVHKKNRRAGLATMLMGMVVSTAQAMEMNLVLRAVPTSDMGCPAAKLRAFYGWVGFKSTPKNQQTMIFARERVKW